MKAYYESALEFSVDMSNIKDVREWIEEGDKEKNKANNIGAIRLYSKALECADEVQRRYLIPRIMACYRRQNNPLKAKDFLIEMIYVHGVDIMDHVTYTVMAAVHGDLNEWNQALECANRACALNEGEINEYLDAVYNRINVNMNLRKCRMVFA